MHVSMNICTCCTLIFYNSINMQLQILHTSNGINSNELMWSLASGPSIQVKSWHTYKVNRYKFQTLEYGDRKGTMNSGVCVRGSNYGNDESDFYGILEEVIELDYPNSENNSRKLYCLGVVGSIQPKEAQEFIHNIGLLKLIKRKSVEKMNHSY